MSSTGVRSQSPVRSQLPSTPNRCRSALAWAILASAFLPALGGPGDAIIDNGTVQLGVHCEGHFNVPGGSPSSGVGSTFVGVRYLATNADAISPGCLCEGWGAAGNGFSGWANEVEGGANNLSNVSCSQPAPDSFESIVEIGGQLRVKHLYRPSKSRFLYEGVVTITNINEVFVEDVRYRRVLDWDVEPTAFSEFVTVVTAGATKVAFSSDDGFGTANPLGARSQIAFSGEAIDNGPIDHGALFDLELGGLDVGQSVSFRIYYGAAGTEVDADKALGAVGAETYTYGQSNTPDGPTLGTPNTFMFGFKGVGGSSIFPGSGVPLPEVGEESAAIGAKSRTGSAVAFAGDLNPGAGPNFDDYIAGAPGFSDVGAEEIGAVAVYLGSADAAERASADVVFVGESPHDRLGVAVAANFDFDGDGNLDLVRGAEQVNRTGEDDTVNGCLADAACGPGKTYLIYWDPADYPNLGNPALQDTILLSELNMPGKPKGVVFTGAALGDQAGFSVAAGGPVGQDSVRPDLGIGAPGRDVPGDGGPDRVDAGTAYLIFNTGQPDNFDANGRFLESSYGLDRVACTHFPPNPCLATDELAGIQYVGESGPGPGDTMGDQVGFSVAFPGDIVEPVGEDFAFGAPGFDRLNPLLDADSLNGGSGYGIGRKSSGIIEVCEIGTPPAVDQGVGGVQILGDQAGEQLGYWIAGGGDNLANGEDDLLIGAPFYDVVTASDQGGDDAGRMGQSGGRLSSGIIEVCEIGAPPAVDEGGIEGAIWLGAEAGDLFGSSGIGLGDVTGNGGDDIAMGAPLRDPDDLINAGTVYLVEGPDVIADAGHNLFRGEISVAKIGVSIAGRQLNGTNDEQESGAAVSRIGDHDGNGDGDFAAGCPGRNDDDGVVCTVLESQGLSQLTNEPPTADASASDTLAECSGLQRGQVDLDGRLSSDPDSTVDTNDDIASFDWFEDFGLGTESPIGSGALLSNVSFDLGSHDVTLEVTDLAGASDTDAIVVTVQDTVAPAFTLCPADASVECTGASSAAVTLPAAQADDQCDNGETISNTRTGASADASDTYPLGTTVVTFTATDAAGNANASCQTSVTVEDTVAPALTCPASLELIGAACLGSREVPLDAVSADDACDAALLGVSPSLVACEGSDTAVYTATDVGGNESSCPVAVTVACPGPAGQGYWHRQCLGVPAREGGIDPGRNGRGPEGPTEPGFQDELMPCAQEKLEDLGIFGEETCEGMDANPPSDPCERALKQLTALVLNDCSQRVEATCGVDLSAQGCSSTDLGGLLQELADLINSGQCDTAEACAAEINTGGGLLGGGAGAPGDVPSLELDAPDDPIEGFTPLAPRRRAVRALTVEERASATSSAPLAATAGDATKAVAPRTGVARGPARGLARGTAETEAPQLVGHDPATAGAAPDGASAAVALMWSRLAETTDLDARLRILAQLAGPGLPLERPGALRREVESLLEAARARGDDDLAVKAERLLERLSGVVADPPGDEPPTTRPTRGGRRAF